MDLVLFLLRSSRRMVLGTLAASVLGGACGAVLIAVINRALTGKNTNSSLIAAAFFLVVLVKISTNLLAQAMLLRFAQDVIVRLCRGLCKTILQTPFQKLEALGPPRLLTTLTDDVAALSAAVLAVPILGTNAAVVAGCGIYLAWLSWKMFLMSAIMILIGVVGYQMLLMRARQSIHAARDGRDRLLKNFRTLIEGVKELKLHRMRQETFLREEIDETTEHLRQQNIAAADKYIAADAWSQLLFYALIGVLLFGAPKLTVLSTQTLTGYVFAALYMMSPVWSLIHTVPTFMRGSVSLDKIREIDAELLASSFRESFVGDDVTIPDLVDISLEKTIYAYPPSEGEERGFTLGPTDLRLRSGEITFVTGGNGSGKSTLVKLLSGLYLPQSGRIVLNGRVVEDENREYYRQHFSVVFADFHIFERLFGLGAAGRETEIQQYLALLQIDQNVRIRGDRFSTTALSTGQRKRLALLTAYLEGRPVCIFDEWAADQDPVYKEIFYHRLLPDLKTQGKCVVVITHDDRYFHLGDRVVHLEAGALRLASGRQRTAAVR